MPPDPSPTGATPAMPNNKEDRSDGGCVSGTTAPATEVSMSCPGAMTSDTGTERISHRRHHTSNRRDQVGNRCDPSVTGATTPVTGATTSVTGGTKLVRAAPAGATTFGTAATGLGTAGTRPALSLVLGVRAASLSRGACRAGGRRLAWLPARAQCARRAGGRLLAWLRARARRPRYALNRLPHSVSNVADRAACRRAALDRSIGAVIAVRGGTT